MAHKVKTKLLAELVGIAAKTCVNKSTIAILESIVIRFGGKGIEVEATNLENWITLSTPDFEPKGAVTAIVPCSQFQSVISAISDEEISIDLTAKRATIKTENSKYNFGLGELVDWPGIPAEKDCSVIELNAEDFLDAMKFVMPSVGRDEARYYFNGVNIRNGKEGKLRLITTDGHRASMTVLQPINSDPVAIKKDGGIIVPQKLSTNFIDLISRASKDAQIKLTITDTKCRLELETSFKISIIGRLIDGTFPDVDRVVPFERESSTVIIQRQKTVTAISRMSALAEERRFMAINIKNGKMVLSVKSQNGDAEETIACAGEAESKTGCNFRLMQDLLNVFEKEEIQFMLCPKRPEEGVLLMIEKGQTPSPETHRLSIIMPMRG